MVYHVLKDGSITKDISGRVIKVKDAEALYNLIDNINSKRAGSKVEKARGKAS